MKKMKKSISLIMAILMLLTVIPLSASAYTKTIIDGPATYTATVDYSNNGTATLIDYDCSKASNNIVTIYDTTDDDYRNYYIHEISSAAFRNTSKVTRLDIRCNIKSFGVNFSNFSSLETLIIPNSLKSLSDIYGCPNLSYIDLNINSYIKDPYYSTNSGVLFGNNGEIIKRFPPACDIDTYQISKDVKKIDKYAFAETSELKNLVMYPGLSVGYFAFCDSSIEKVYFWGTEEQWNEFASKIECHSANKCGSKICSGEVEVCYPVYCEYIPSTCTEDGREAGYYFEELDLYDGCRILGKQGHSYNYVRHKDAEIPCVEHGTRTGTCVRCGDVVTEEDPELFGCTYGEYKIWKYPQNCYENTTYYEAYCEYCGNRNTYVDKYKYGPHLDDNHDGKCDVCKGDLTSGCKHMCHKNRGKGTGWYRFCLFFWKLFKINRECDCGMYHY